MQRIEWTTQFKRDFKRELKGKHRTALNNHLFPIYKRLANDKPIEAYYRDHALSGNWKDYRDCHIKPDLILIYQKTKTKLFALSD